MSKVVFGGSFLLLLLSGLYNEYLLQIVNPMSIIIGDNFIFTDIVRQEIRSVQVFFFLTGLLGIFAAFVLHKKKYLQKQKTLSKLVSVIVVALISIGTTEFCLYPFFRVSSLFVYDAQCGWKMSPGTHRWSSFRFKINDKGLRGAEIPYKKPSDQKRILFLGDSVIFGLGVEEQQTIPFLTQQHLKETVCINAGICGYAPWQEYQLLLQEGLKYEVDMIVLGICLNDISDKVFQDRNFEGVEMFASNPSSFDLRKSNTYLYLSFIKKIIAFKDYHSVNQDFVNNAGKDLYENVWKKTFANWEKIQFVCANKQIPLKVVIFPARIQFDNKSQDTPQKHIIEFFGAHNTEVLDIYPIFAKHKNPHGFFVDVWHINTQGNAIISKELIEFIKN